MSAHLREPEAIARPVVISEETRNDLALLANLIGHIGYRVNAAMLRKIVAHWDASLVAVVDEDAV